MYQCFHCLNNSVIWSGDFTFEDMGYDGEGGCSHLLLYSLWSGNRIPHSD